MMKFAPILAIVPLALALVPGLYAQGSQSGAASLNPEHCDAEVRELRKELTSINAHLAALESQRSQTEASRGNSEPAFTSTAASTSASDPTPSPAQQTLDASLAFFHSTTFNFSLDGYYGYNFNHPIGRVNLLRAYDVTSNSFNINQASIMVERIPTAQDRLGGRIDLQFGQATEALQGSPANEQRPQVWRNLFQAYGSYLAPIGSGLQIDFGKWASALGNEGNYTKDQIAYSRAYSFNYLPFYHMGLRANYNLTRKINVAYWLVNGANDTEDLNGFKSQAFLFTLKPARTLTWNVNYYFGQEARDVEPTLNIGPPTGPIQPGLPTTSITPAPDGREHIFDTYATWNPTSRFTLVGEADFVLNRTYSHEQPSRVAIGSVMGRYTLPRNWNLGARAEYFDDRGGLFSGKTQALKEITLVADHTLTLGFLARAEYRRDFSNQPFFLTNATGILSRSQTTATLGLIYWWGTKQGAW